LADVLKDLKGALRLAGRMLEAATPLTELAGAQREHRLKEEERERRERAHGCQVCSGKGKVGKKGHEIECPTCQGVIEAVFEVECSVCDDTKKVGAPGHEILCPACR
jgi:RecJ-like exonuclease